MSAAHRGRRRVQVVGGVAARAARSRARPAWKARLQGRRGPTPLQPYRELAGSGARASSTPRARAPSTGCAGGRRRGARRSPCCSSRSPGTRRAGPSATTRSRSSGCSRWRASRSPLPPGTPANGFALMGASRDLTIAVAVEAALVLALACGALAGSTTDLRGHGAGDARAGTSGASPALRSAPLAFAARDRRRDGPPAGRQPRHPPRADDDPRGAAARVRRPRPRLPAVGGRGAALARARARGRRSSCRIPAALAAARRRCRSRSSRSCAALGARRDARREDAHPARPAAARRRRGPARCSASLSRLVGRADERRARLDRRRARRSACSSSGGAASPSALVTVQALVLAGTAAAQASGADELARGRARCSPRAVLAALLLFVVARERASRGPCAPTSGPLVRGGARDRRSRSRSRWLVPSLGLGARDAERAVLALVAFGARHGRDAAGDALPGRSGSSWSRTRSPSRRSSDRRPPRR